MEGLKLASRQVRKGAAGRGPDLSFTAMVFWRFAYLPSSRPCARLPALLAAHLLAFVNLQTAMSQRQNTMAVNDGSGPAAGISECQTLLSELPNFKPSIRLPTFQPPICLPCCTAGSPLLAFPSTSKRRCRSTKTPWQWRTDRARGRQPIVPNVAFWPA